MNTKFLILLAGLLMIGMVTSGEMPPVKQGEEII